MWCVPYKQKNIKNLNIEFLRCCMVLRILKKIIEVVSTWQTKLQKKNWHSLPYVFYLYEFQHFSILFTQMTSNDLEKCRQKRSVYYVFFSINLKKKFDTCKLGVPFCIQSEMKFYVIMQFFLCRHQRSSSKTGESINDRTGRICSQCQWWW